MVSEDYKLKNFRDIVERYGDVHKDNIAFMYKVDPEAKEPEYINKTYNHFQSDIKALSTKLLQMGYEGKKVAIIGPNSYRWCVSYLAVTAGNMSVVPLDKLLPNVEIKNLIKRSRAEVVIFNKAFLEVFKEMQNANDTDLKTYISMEEVEDEGVLNYSDLIIEGENLRKAGDKSYEKVEVNPEEISIILFTSGTTSQAKAVLLTQKNICENIMAANQRIYLGPTDRMLSFLPLHHTFESTTTFLLGTTNGISIAICDGLKHISANFKEYKITAFVCVPLLLETLHNRILKGIEKQGKTKTVNMMIKITQFMMKFGIDLRRKVFKSVIDNLGGHLRLVVSGAAPLGKETIIGVQNFGIKIIQGYGLTETSPVLAAEGDVPEERRAGSVGRALKGLEVKIDSPNENGIGEIIAKGPSIMQGYYENKEATDEVLKDGWFYTGDLGYIDEDGFIYVKGRKKTVIVLKNGKNIFPEEIEALVNEKDHVAESMVFGKEKNDGDYTLGIKIVYNKEAMEEKYPNNKVEDYEELLKAEIKEINKTMPAYKYIREVHVTDAPLIKTTTQKIKRHEEIKTIIK